MLKTAWYYFVKLYVKTGLFFYTKKIKVSGLENIPKKDAVLFVSNHPNGLLDPLIIATHNPRINHFLVRAAVFKNPLTKKILASLNLMPIYRIRDGKDQLSKNNEIFNHCFELLKNKETLLIFPEGTHNQMRRIRPINKGFTRILFGAIDKYPDLEITVIPVGITYQKVSFFPSKIALKYGKPIRANTFYNRENLHNATNTLKEKVKTALEKNTVCITQEKNYTNTLSKLNKANVDFTNVDAVNQMLQKETYPLPKKATKNYTKPLLYLIVLNSLIPYFLWKKIEKKIDEIEFIDTFRFGLNTVLFPLFYALQSLVIYRICNLKIASMYFIASFLLVFIYSKSYPTNTKG
ncbi:lysophospholipid acyltransferase family protein [Tenacibaculum sp. UWU-22]|uniref:lysophospholipid acyltransferase family protein n=1 Tax=Tenacibaculum sp. UWU-22 TaxID=3234187 RepID=UPI0034DB6F98